MDQIYAPHIASLFDSIGVCYFLPSFLSVNRLSTGLIGWDSTAPYSQRGSSSKTPSKSAFWSYRFAPWLRCFDDHPITTPALFGLSLGFRVRPTAIYYQMTSWLLVSYFVLQEKKKLVFDGTVGGDSASMAKLTVDDMRFLFQWWQTCLDCISCVVSINKLTITLLLFFIFMVTEIHANPMKSLRTRHMSGLTITSHDREVYPKVEPISSE